MDAEVENFYRSINWRAFDGSVCDAGANVFGGGRTVMVIRMEEKNGKVPIDKEQVYLWMPHTVIRLSFCELDLHPPATYRLYSSRVKRHYMAGNLWLR